MAVVLDRCEGLIHGFLRANAYCAPAQQRFERMAAYYAERARGGVGMVITGGIYPNTEAGRGSKLSTPAEAAQHRKITEAVHAEDPDVKIVMQILHTGPLARTPDCVAASAVKSRIGTHTPHALDAAALQRMPAVTIKPTLEYDSKPHTLKGPLLTTVLAAAGVAAGSPVQLVLRAVDGYNVTISMADVQAYRMIVANHIDGQPMALGGLGPQWAVYDADVLPSFKDKPVKERFGLCPWGLYHIEVKKV